MHQLKPRIKTAILYCIFGARDGWNGIVEQLLEKGASIEALNNDGHTPLDLAEKSLWSGPARVLKIKAAELELVKLLSMQNDRN